MKQNRIITYKKRRKFENFLDSCERQLLESDNGIMHKRDLIAGAKTKTGTRMMCGVPMAKGVHVHFIRDSKQRFVWLGKGMVGLAKRGVELE